ncbi:hypothetical protein PLICRDRAFT_45333 [Plicaturopsis crispa FD-325 SS-3]|uniref:Small RNA 2'-O-methyltransferase n=1 Tax=Plicaturopsis crispa FD-325 SS-3 TaxID=944288 RepID=A0A0C9T798_PLICR|nr:hypothetical protein PLICRDRAFT_45333 [Plicaturopsis crispa FD-325 SS-3]
MEDDAILEEDHEQESSAPLEVRFFPPLYQQRRIWVLDILRRENVTRVVDVGCGEGELLRALSQPAFYLRPEYETNSTTPVSPASAYPEEFTNLHCTDIAGLDVLEPDLGFAVEATAPPKEDEDVVRWEPLEAKIWKGGLEVFNPAFMDFECIVSTEVIEHLPEDVLPKFADMLLGVYHPRLFLVTTPSYTFNARFTPPGVTERNGFPDPTGRTDRVFRHSDHKFEWTVEEFKEWCTTVAEQWGYDVITETTGRAVQDDPWGRDAELGGASQNAEFRRRDDQESVQKRAQGRQAVLDNREESQQEHELLATHQHTAHPLAQKPAGVAEIADAVWKSMIASREAFAPIEQLWFDKNVSTLCGGWLERLIQAVEQDERFELFKGEAKSRCGWRVGLVGVVEQDMDSWEPVSVGDVSVDPFESWSGDSGGSSTVLEGDSDVERDEESGRELYDEEDAADQWPGEEGEGWGSNDWPEDAKPWANIKGTEDGDWGKEVDWKDEDGSDVAVPP